MDLKYKYYKKSITDLDIATIWKNIKICYTMSIKKAYQYKKFGYTFIEATEECEVGNKYLFIKYRGELYWIETKKGKDTRPFWNSKKDTNITREVVEAYLYFVYNVRRQRQYGNSNQGTTKSIRQVYVREN